MNGTVKDNDLVNASLIMRGWQCPFCGQVYSPFVSKCPNYHGSHKTSSSSSWRIVWPYIPSATTDGAIGSG